MLHTARVRAGLTQAGLAARSMVAQSNIAAYESGRRPLSDAMLTRLVSAMRERPSELVRRHCAEIRAIVGANRGQSIKVFGSVARGEDTPDSDVDLLVRMASDASLFDLVRMRRGIEELLDRKVDLVSEGGLLERDRHILGEAVPV